MSFCPYCASGSSRCDLDERIDAKTCYFNLVQIQMPVGALTSIVALGIPYGVYLLPLAQRAFTAEMTSVPMLTDHLAAELPTVLAEHQAIVAALERLVDAADLAERTDIVEFARTPAPHPQTEDQVTNPAALFVGSAVRDRLTKAAPAH